MHAKVVWRTQGDENRKVWRLDVGVTIQTHCPRLAVQGLLEGVDYTAALALVDR